MPAHERSITSWWRGTAASHWLSSHRAPPRRAWRLPAPRQRRGSPPTGCALPAGQAPPTARQTALPSSLLRALGTAAQGSQGPGRARPRPPQSVRAVLPSAVASPCRAAARSAALCPVGVATAWPPPHRLPHERDPDRPHGPDGVGPGSGPAACSPVTVPCVRRCAWPRARHSRSGNPVAQWTAASHRVDTLTASRLQGITTAGGTRRGHSVSAPGVRLSSPRSWRPQRRARVACRRPEPGGTAPRWPSGPVPWGPPPVQI